MQGDIGERERQSRAAQEVAIIEATIVEKENQNRQRVAVSEKDLAVVRAECERERKLAEIAVLMATDKRKAELETEVDRARTQQQIAFLQSTQVRRRRKKRYLGLKGPYLVGKLKWTVERSFASKELISIPCILRRDRSDHVFIFGSGQSVILILRNWNYYFDTPDLELRPVRSMSIWKYIRLTEYVLGSVKTFLEQLNWCFKVDGWVTSN